MELNTKCSMVITTETDEEKMRIGTAIHEQLVGNPDYINCSIILNVDEPCTIRLYVDKSVPELNLNIPFVNK